MPHERARYAERRIRRAIAFSPVTGVVGQRQVGKTTLLERVASSYTTLDRERDLLESLADPESFIRDRKAPFAIDEAQLCPGLFPAIKEAVRLMPRPGRFLLSGSVRFTSREQIRESLTGRIVTVELLPFTISEIHGLPLTHTLISLPKVTKQRELERFVCRKRSYDPKRAFESYLKTGGLPGICFFRDEYVRAEKLTGQIDTQLNRDIRLVSQTTLPYASLRALLAHISRTQGQPFELKAASLASQISTVTLKKILFAFEALFLVRSIPSCGPERKACFFLEDQGMATWLKGSTLLDSADICRGLYANLRQEFFYRPELNGKIEQYRTKNGVIIPLVFSWRDGIVGVLPTVDRYPAPKTLGSAQAFLKKNPRAKVVLAVNGDEIIAKSERLFIVPYWLLA